ncbi:MAG: VanW family protein [bacterium]
MNNRPNIDINYHEEVPTIRRGFSYLGSQLNRAVRVLGVFAFSSVLIATSFISYDYIRTRKAFPQNSFIGEVNVSGLSQEEALAKLKSLSLGEVYTPLITLETDAVSFAFSPEQLGVSVLYKETVDRAFQTTHKSNYFDELQERIAQGIFAAPLLLKIDEEQLRLVLEEAADNIHSLPKDSYIVYYEETGGYNIFPEDVGRELELDKSVKVFKRDLAVGKVIIPLVIKFTNPRLKEHELRANPPVYLLGAYTTYYGSHDSPNRIHNIKLVASWIDDTLLLPGEEFSVAEVLGDVTEEKGFKEAFVILGGELVPLLGGGSCQIATTLYNAVSLADLKVLQRRNHSFYFNIYPLGRDAGVYPGQLDFRFENDTDFPILIKTVATDKLLSFRIFGTPTGKVVKFSDVKILGRNENGGFSPITLKKTIDEDIPFKTLTTRTVYDKAGNIIKEEEISSFYKLYGDKENVPIRGPEPR